MFKSKLRLQVINELKKLSPSEKLEIETLLYTHLFASNVFQESSVIGTTFSQTFEWNTRTIMEKAWKLNKTIVAPKTDPMTRQLHFHEVCEEDELEIGYSNISEPIGNTSKQVDKEDIDLLIVPGIVFDQYGYRIGFGGGYYDRFLTDFNKATVSIASKLQFVEKVPVQSYDIAVDFLVTEDGFYRSKI